MPNISDAIKEATKILEKSKIAEPIKEANSLLSLALQKDRTFFIAHNDYRLNKDENEQFWNFVKRRSKREPFQHIAGKQEFWGLDFIVSPDVLVPRPETELIVEHSIEILKNLDNPNFCEVGIGSGAISVSILHEVENAKAFSVDVSEKAIQVAEQNALEHKVLNRLTLKTSDVFEVLEENKQFNLIVSNPPYIPNEDIPTLQKEVRDFDPHIALTDGKDGLSIIKQIINESPKHLKNKGFLLMEIGINQSENVRDMFDLQIWQSLDFLPDLQGIPRMIKAQKK